MNEIPPLSTLHGGQTARRSSIRTQLIFWNVLTLALLLGVMGIVILYTVHSTIMNSVDRDLDARSRPMVDRRPPFDRPPPPGGFGMSPRDGGNPPRSGDKGPPPDHRFDRPQGDPSRNVDRYLWPDRRFDGPRSDPFRQQFETRPSTSGDLNRPRFFNLSGRPTAPFETYTLWDAQGFEQAKLDNIAHYSTVIMNGEPYRVLSRRFPIRGPEAGVLQIPYPLTDVNRAISGLNRALLLLIPVALLCAGMGGASLTNRMLFRVRRMAQAAGYISARDFSARLPVIGNDEFAELTVTFNALLGRLETAFRQQENLIEQQRRFTADASHELKTPLTIIKGNTSMALSAPGETSMDRQSLQEMDQAANTMLRLVQDLLLLARSDGGQLGNNRIELLVEDVIEQAFMRVGKQAHAPFQMHLADASLSIMGNEEEIVRLFSNLLQNAARYTPENGQITIRARRRGDSVAVSVADTGIGIAPRHLPHLGERFYRVDDSRSRHEGGTGLGLSICKGIVEANQGSMTFESALDQGTTVTVFLPAPR